MVTDDDDLIYRGKCHWECEARKLIMASCFQDRSSPLHVIINAIQLLVSLSVFYCI